MQRRRGVKVVSDHIEDGYLKATRSYGKAHHEPRCNAKIPRENLLKHHYGQPETGNQRHSDHSKDNTGGKCSILLVTHLPDACRLLGTPSDAVSGAGFLEPFIAASSPRAEMLLAWASSVLPQVTPGGHSFCELLARSRRGLHDSR
jgi:hypothetical protein